MLVPSMDREQVILRGGRGRGTSERRFVVTGGRPAADKCRGLNIATRGGPGGTPR